MYAWVPMQYVVGWWSSESEGEESEDRLHEARAHQPCRATSSTSVNTHCASLKLSEYEYRCGIPYHAIADSTHLDDMTTKQHSPSTPSTLVARPSY